MNGDDFAQSSIDSQNFNPGLTKYEHMVIEFTKELLHDKYLEIEQCVDTGIRTANEVIKQLKQNNGKQ